MQVVDVQNRFGWGARPGDAPPREWRTWLIKQIEGPDQVLFEGVGPSAEGLIALRSQRQDKLRGNPLVKPILKAELTTQLRAVLESPQPFRERLAWFWFNHFTVSLKQDRVKSVAGAYMREAIRPHVTGRFVDMLVAVMRHPAMLMYLDNVASVGPQSPAGLRQNRGLNENLARECLELHTVSPASGYTQADVTSFAAILTGWGVDMKADTPGFRFNPRAHQPGDKSLMGQSFAEGEEGGVAALAFLGTHPATYRHIATQMLRHFLTDTPNPGHVAALTAALQRSDGSLLAATHALIECTATVPAGTKLRTPMEYAAAALRASGIGNALDGQAANAPHPPALVLASACSALGQPVWTAPMPNGWSDLASDWSAPSDMLARTDWAYRLAGGLHDANPEELAQTALGSALRPATRLAMQHAGSRRDALTLLFSSPEFQRR